jgi:hypothetical protein
LIGICGSFIAAIIARGRLGAMREHPLEFFVKLERRVWDALAAGDAAADHELLSDDFLGVYPTGFADRADHVGQLVDGATIASYSLDDTRVVRISSTASLLCYRAEYRRIRAGVIGATETMFVSSLWTEADGQWRNVFSQDTPAP